MTPFKGAFVKKTTLPPRPLTLKEKKVLEFIESYIGEQGIAPSYQEIKEHFGFASFNSIQRYLKQLQDKSYIHIPPGNQKRAITVLHSSNAIQSSMGLMSRPMSQPTQTNFSQPKFSIPNSKKEAPHESPPVVESLSLPLLGKVAAGLPLEASEHNEFIEAPASMIRQPHKTYALRVVGQSMIEDGILDGDVIFVERREGARNGETVVAVIEQEATVKKFFMHNNPQAFQQSKDTKSSLQVELRPANSQMESFWYRPDQVQIQGVVVGLIRQFK
jgi:repressor LexA